MTSSLNAALLATSSVSTLCSCLILLGFFTVKKLRAWPGPLIIWRAVCDLGFSVQFIAFERIGQTKESVLCGLNSALFQFFAIGGLTWFAVFSINFWLSFEDPFTRPSSRSRWYHLLVWSIASCTAIAVSFHSTYRPELAQCWTRDRYGLNVMNWVVVFAPLLVYWLGSLAILGVAYKRLMTGSAEYRRVMMKTLETRRDALRVSAVYVAAFTLYWSLVGILYSLIHLQRDDARQSSELSHAFTGVLTMQGMINFLVWFVVNQSTLVRLLSVRWSKFIEKRDDHTDMIAAHGDAPSLDRIRSARFSAYQRRALGSDQQPTLSSHQSTHPINTKLRSNTRGVIFASVQDLMTESERITADLSSALREDFIRFSFNGIQQSMLALIAHERQQNPLVASHPSFLAASPSSIALHHFHTEQPSISTHNYPLPSFRVDLRFFEQQSDSLSPPSLQQPSSKLQSIRVHFSEPTFVSPSQHDIHQQQQNRPSDVHFRCYAPREYYKIRMLCHGVAFDLQHQSADANSDEQAHAFNDFFNSFHTAVVSASASQFSEGRSGSFFFFSNDRRYLIKTLTRDEHVLLLKLLPSYTRHLERSMQPDKRCHTLISLFLGQYSLEMFGKVS